MKKFISGIFAMLCLLVCLMPVAAQSSKNSIPELDFNKAYEDYLYNYNLYSEAHKEYQLAKNQYQTYQTLTAKTIALEQTAKMLVLRNEVIATFLNTIRAKMAQETNIANISLNTLYVQLDKEVTWFLDNKEALASAGTIPDLIRLSDETQTHYQKTETLLYQSLLEVFFFKETDLRTKIEAQITNLEKLIAEIRANGDKDPTKIERWLIEAKNKKDRSDEKYLEAKNIKISSSNRGSSLSSFNTAKQLLEESHQYLRETNLNLIETVKEIKRSD